MNILFVNRWYPPFTGFGGVAAYDYYLAHALMNQGHHVEVIAARWLKSMPGRQVDGDVTVHRILTENSTSLRHIPLLRQYAREIEQSHYSKMVARKINELNKKSQFDIVEFAEVNAEGFWYLHQKAHLPVVIRCHTPTFILKDHYFLSEMNYDILFTEKMEKYCIRNADLLTAPSHDMAQVIIQSTPEKLKPIHVMPNPLDLAIFKPQKKITQPDQITILHVGRMERVKGIEVLLQAVPVVLQTCPKAQFIFAGDGSVEYTAALKKQLANFDLEDDQIIFTGVISQDQLIGLYQEADIAVVPSLNYESFSYTVAQAMACALPVVASCIGGIPETVGNENAAILIKPGDVQCLANALITLCQNKELRKEMGKNGRSRAEEYFSADKVGEKIIKSYAQISK